MQFFLYNCVVYPFTTEEAKWDCILIEGEKIKAIGRREELAKHLGSEVHHWDMEGAMVTPGLVDAHTHFLKYATNLLGVDLKGCDSLAVTLESIKAGLAKLPPGEWLVGGGWDKNVWGTGWPTRSDLDAVTGSTPAALFSRDYHSLWVNTAALEAAGITAEIPDVPGGVILRDKEGHPVGILKENANNLIKNAIPPASLERSQEALHAGMETALSLGLTGVHTFEDEKTLFALEQLHRAGELKIRFLMGIPSPSLDKAKELGLCTSLGDPFLRIGPLKVFVDGALGSQTAALLEPYCGEEGKGGYRGVNVMEEKELFKLVEDAIKGGFAVAIHAIGDWANQMAIDSLERVAHISEKFNLRHRIEHAQLVVPQDIKRFARLGLIASIQPSHLRGDIPLIKKYWGEERGKWTFSCRSLLEAGADIAFGSDAPVETIDPIEGIRGAITRYGFNQDENLTPYQAVKCYTLGSALAAGEEDKKGTIEEGKLADLTVFSKDFIAQPSLLDETEIVATFVNGQVYHRI